MTCGLFHPTQYISINNDQSLNVSMLYPLTMYFLYLIILCVETQERSEQAYRAHQNSI